MADYKCVATTPEGFIQQLAVSYVAHGYWFYVSGLIPETKDPSAIDRKLISKYGIGISKWARARRKRAGIANVHYLRHGRFFVVLATHGRHPFFVEEPFKDIREVPIKFASYSVSFRGGHAHVRIERETYRDLKAYFMERALRRSRETLEREFWNIGFEPYAPVRRQLVTMFNRVNAARRTAQFEELSQSCLRLRRRIYRPFESLLESEAA